LRHNSITATGKEFLISGLERNKTLLRLLLDGKPTSQIIALLERNRALYPSVDPLVERDIALIQSVYRTSASQPQK
jgi:hypothetical protein